MYMRDILQILTFLWFLLVSLLSQLLSVVYLFSLGLPNGYLLIFGIFIFVAVLRFVCTTDHEILDSKVGKTYC